MEVPQSYYREYTSPGTKFCMDEIKALANELSMEIDFDIRVAEIGEYITEVEEERVKGEKIKIRNVSDDKDDDSGNAIAVSTTTTTWEEAYIDSPSQALANPETHSALPQYRESLTSYCTCSACAFAVSEEHNEQVTKEVPAPRHLPPARIAATRGHVLG
ncbi:hypothetical protein BDQ17DRAFT_1427438 [Cyathus striatus]|nr:hypothetical protein BDQ17DRAFT_1427438 [Cyathus striatus]